MSEYPAVHDPGSIELLLNHIRTSQPPALINEDYLVSAGFRRETDESLENLMEFLGIMEKDGVPTELWDAIRHKGKGPKLLAEAIKAGYWKLFKAVPDANAADGRPLMEFFKQETKASDQEAAYMILTFKVLCDLANFGKQAPAGRDQGKKEEANEEPEDADKAAPDVEEPPTPDEEESLERIFDDTSKVTSTGAMAATDATGGLRLSLQIDLDPASDHELRNLLLKLLRKQLEKG
jgi:hypothetical protein